MPAIVGPVPGFDEEVEDELGMTEVDGSAGPQEVRTKGKRRAQSITRMLCLTESTINVPPVEPGRSVRELDIR
jgi:hypothetical protein